MRTKWDSLFKSTVAMDARLPRRIFVGAALCCAVWMVSGRAQATTYYVDNVAGNDNNAGTSVTGAWQTALKVTTKGISTSAPFSPGDVILFKNGGVWRDRLALTSAGTAGSPIVIGAYGSSTAKPIISGADLVSPSLWKAYSGHIYVAAVGRSLQPAQVYVDGTYYELARYPANGYMITPKNAPNASTVIGPLSLTAQQAAYDSTMAAASLGAPSPAKMATLSGLSASQIAGATVVARPNSWTAQAAPVASDAAAFDPGTGTIVTSTAMSSGLVAGNGFYLRNQLWMLKVAQQWYYDAVAGNLYVWTTTGDSPANHVVEMADRANGIQIAGKGYVTVQNIEETYGQIGVLSSSTTSGVIFNNLTVIGGLTGISLSTCATCGGTVENNLVSGSLRYGVIVNGGTGVTVSNNTVKNAGFVMHQPDGGIAAIKFRAINSVISDNVITNSGYSGISFNGANVSVLNNNINGACLKLDDCGAIYTSASAPNDDEVGDVISGNTINNLMGNYSGTIDTYTKAMGIYIDDYRHDVKVTNNFISNADNGIYIHNGYNHVVTGNRIFSARQSGIRISADRLVGYTTNNTIEGNVFQTLATANSGGYAAANYTNHLASNVNFGTFNYNIYCHPNMAGVVADMVTTGAAATSATYTLAAWQHSSGQDAKSTDTTGTCNGAPPRISN